MVKDPSAFRCILMAAEDSYRLERPRRVRKEPKGLRESGLAPKRNQSALLAKAALVSAGRLPSAAAFS